jgi:hypothetical protein
MDGIAQMSSSASTALKTAGAPPSTRAKLERGASHKWLVAIAVMLGATLEVLDTSIVSVSLPHMRGRLFGQIRSEKSVSSNV